MKKKPFFTTCGILLAATACNDSPLEAPETDLVVVEAFLFAAEPVRDIRITSTLPLSSGGTVAPPINDAEVRLIEDGIVYELSPTGENGFYEYPGSDLVVRAGDHFQIEVTYFGRTATGETSVPPAPEAVAISGDTVFAPTIGVGGGGPRGGRIDLLAPQLTVAWSNPDELLHFVVVDGLEDVPQSIFPERLQGRLSRFRLISRPTTDSWFDVTLGSLRDLGTHRVKVYRVNEEYAQLYENRTQDSRDLNEPPSNIVGGLGVFSAFNSDSVFFEVARQ